MLQVRFYIAKSKDGKATMVQVFRNRKGKRTNRSYIDASGKLILTVKLKSPLLPKPLTYEVTYCRERGS